MLIDHLRRTVASIGGTLHEFPTRSTKLSQYCHGCKTYVKKPLSQRWHECACGTGPVQRDLYSAWLAAHLDPANNIPAIAQDSWEGADLRRESVRLPNTATNRGPDHHNEGRQRPQIYGCRG